MKILVAFLFVLSILIQLFFVFSSPYGIDSDQAITGLMAKHILEGRFPVFFYGHAFDGSIEATVASLFFLVFGISCHSLKLAPIVFGIIFCISMYYLGKELGDKKLGLWAFIFSILAPIYLLGHFIAPRTCYIETLAFGNLMFIFLLKAIRQPRLRNVFLLGLFSGVSFWNSPLSIYYLLSAAIFIVIRGWRLINLKNISLGMLSFTIGSLPLWIYNFTHHFESFKIGYSTAGTNFVENLKNLFIYHGPILLVSGVFSNTLFYWFIYGIFLLCIGLFIVKNIYRFKSGNLLLIIFFTLILIIYSKSQYALLNTQRHLIPFYTFIPIAVSYSCRYLNRYKNTGAVLFILIVGINLSGSLLIHRQWLPGTLREDKACRELKNFLLDNKITTIYAPFWTGHKLNFISKEAIICSEYSEEVYSGYEEVLDRADTVAFLNDGTHRIGESLNRIKAGFSKVSVSGKDIFYNITQPSLWGKSLIPGDWRITSNYNLSKIKGAVDRNYDKSWVSGRTIEGIYPYIQIDLGKSYSIYKIIVFNKGCLISQPCVNIYVSKDGDRWDLQNQASQVEPVFWSGPRPYYVRWFGRQEFRFDPVETRYVKIEYPTNEYVEVDEVFVYQYKRTEERDLASYKGCLTEVVDFLKDKDIDFVYADFWPSTKIREFSGGTVETLRQINKGYPYRRYTSRELSLSNKKAFLINDEDTDEFENVLNELGIKLKRKEFGYYSLYYSSGSVEKEFVWSGLGLLKARMIDYNINNWKYPPGVEKDIRFKNGVEFLGYNLYTSKRLIPKKYIKIDYFWKVYKNIPEGLFVFVHFTRNGKTIFQNDHLFLEQFPIREIQSGGEIFKETYLVKIPSKVDSGKYDIYIGLWLPERSKRIPIKGRINRVKIGELYVYSGI